MRRLLFCLLTALLGAAAPPAQAAAPEPIRIGEMMPATNGTVYATAYREGWAIALEEINAQGGIHGRPLEVIARDDKASPSEGIRLAEELVHRDKVVMLMGAGFDHVGLAVGTWANRNKIPFIKQWAVLCRYFDDPANLYFFASQPCAEKFISVFSQHAAQQPHKRWAFLAPDYEFGHSYTEGFQSQIKRLRPDVEFVATRYVPLGRINAQTEVRALQESKPDALYILIFGPDLASYLRQARTLGFDPPALSPEGAIGQAPAQRSLGELYPKGWFVYGVPPEAKGHPAQPFMEKYRKRYGKDTDMLALSGYNTLLAIAAALRQTPSLEPEAIAKALSSVSFDGPFGHTRFYKNQMKTGFWTGTTDRKDAKNVLTNVTWHPADELFPEDKR